MLKISSSNSNFKICFVILLFILSCVSSVVSGNVLPSDTILLPPARDGPILGVITGYKDNLNEAQPCPKKFTNYPDGCEKPIYKTFDRDTATFWDSLIDELLLSRVDVVLLHGRGCWEASGTSTRGEGNMCPKLLSKFVDAVERANAWDAIRVGMWDDTASYPGTKRYVENLPPDTKFDLSDEKNWKYFWDHNIKIWFDTIPKRLWYLMDGRPIIAWWALHATWFTNHDGNVSRLIRWLTEQFETRYRVKPAFIMDRFSDLDPTIQTTDAVGEHEWTNHKEPYKKTTYRGRQWAGEEWGALLPSFRDADTLVGCGSSCREYPRNHGNSLRAALDDGKNAKFIVMEGWTDIMENAGFYRSKDDAWDYPNQFINIVREYADPAPTTLRFQAEAADSFLDKSTGNRGNSYINSDLDIGKLDDNTGYYVGWTEAGEYIEYQHVKLPTATYRFTARVSAASGGKMLRLNLPGLSSVTVPNTGSFDVYELVHLGEIKLDEGEYTFRIVFETGAVNLDWFFMKRSDGATPEPDNSAFISQTIPSVMKPGSQTTITINYQNTGSNTWTASSDYSLGVVDHNYNTIWSISKVQLAGGVSVDPGQTTPFIFTITAPLAKGTYNIQFSMVKGASTVFGARSNLAAILVTEATVIDPCSPNPCLNGGICSIVSAGYECDCVGTGYNGHICENTDHEDEKKTVSPLTIAAFVGAGLAVVGTTGLVAICIQKRKSSKNIERLSSTATQHSMNSPSHSVSTRHRTQSPVCSPVYRQRV